MDLKEYTELSRRYAFYPEAGKSTVGERAYLALGLAGEVGEAVDCVKKMFRSPDDIKIQQDQFDKLYYELGDIMWYWTGLCKAFGIDPDEVLESNITKLTSRHG